MELTGDDRLQLDRLLWYTQLVIAAETGITPILPSGRWWEIKSPGVNPQTIQNDLQRWRMRLSSGE
jgi:hypothetical protein